MSDAASINAILSQQISAQKNAEPPTNATIIEASDNVEKQGRQQTVRGKVTRTDNDGTVSVRTDKGEVKVKPDKTVKIEDGDTVEIRIDRNASPQTANIRVVKENAPAPLATQTTITEPVTLPPNLSAQKLLNSPPIQVELISPQQAQSLSYPFTENVQIDFNLTAIQPTLLPSEIANFVTENVELLTAPISELSLTTTAPLLQAQELVAPTQHPLDENLLLAALPAIQTKIPFSIVAAQQITNPNAETISVVLVNVTIPETSAFTLQTDENAIPKLSVFSEVSVRDITPPLFVFSDTQQPPSSVGFETPRILEIPDGRATDTRAELTGFTIEKHFPVLKILTPETHKDQHYILQTPVEDIPLGTQINLDITKNITVTSPDVLQLLPHPFPVLTTSYYLTPERWPVVQEIQNILNQVAAPVAQNVNAVLPNAGNPSQLANATLFFIAALRSGDIQSWLGTRALDALKKAGKTDLVNRLGAELSGLSRLNSEPISQEWRTLSMPLAWQNEIHKVVLHYRREDDASPDQDQNSGKKTRFVMDLNLSKIGKMQLDGLFIGNTDDAGRLDLILRTEQSFSEAMKAEMRGKYKDALDETKITGELSFQDKKEQWLNITPDTLSHFSENI